MANRFVDDSELTQVDLGDGDWVKIPTRLSYGVIEKFASAEAGEAQTPFFKSIIKEWNLKDKDGKAMPISEDNIRKLDLESFKTIALAVNAMMEVSKKVEPPSAVL